MNFSTFFPTSMTMKRRTHSGLLKNSVNTHKASHNCMSIFLKLVAWRLAPLAVEIATIWSQVQQIDVLSLSQTLKLPLEMRIEYSPENALHRSHSRGQYHCQNKQSPEMPNAWVTAPVQSALTYTAMPVTWRKFIRIYKVQNKIVNVWLVFNMMARKPSFIEYGNTHCNEISWLTARFISFNSYCTKVGNSVRARQNLKMKWLGSNYLWLNMKEVTKLHQRKEILPKCQYSELIVVVVQKHR